MYRDDFIWKRESPHNWKEQELRKARNLASALRRPGYPPSGPFWNGLKEESEIPETTLRDLVALLLDFRALGVVDVQKEDHTSVRLGGLFRPGKHHEFGSDMRVFSNDEEMRETPAQYFIRVRGSDFLVTVNDRLPAPDGRWWDLNRPKPDEAIEVGISMEPPFHFGGFAEEAFQEVETRFNTILNTDYRKKEGYRQAFTIPSPPRDTETSRRNIHARIKALAPMAWTFRFALYAWTGSVISDETWSATVDATDACMQGSRRQDSWRIEATWFEDKVRELGEHHSPKNPEFTQIAQTWLLLRLAYRIRGGGDPGEGIKEPWNVRHPELRDALTYFRDLPGFRGMWRDFKNKIKAP